MQGKQLQWWGAHAEGEAIEGGGSWRFEESIHEFLKTNIIQI